MCPLAGVFTAESSEVFSTPFPPFFPSRGLAGFPFISGIMEVEAFARETREGLAVVASAVASLSAVASAKDEALADEKEQRCASPRPRPCGHQESKRNAY